MAIPGLALLHFTVLMGSKAMSSVRTLCKPPASWQVLELILEQVGKNMNFEVRCHRAPVVTSPL